MPFEHEKRQANHLLDAIENATLSHDDTLPLVRDADPAWVYMCFAWLRAWYPPSHPAADGVLGRIVDLCSASGAVARSVREGQSDPITAWFEEAYDYRELDRKAFVDLVVEKLEG